MHMTFTVIRSSDVLLAEPDGDSEKYLMQIDARLHHGDSIVGHLHATKILLRSATDDGQPWFDVCDAHQATYDVYAAMCEDGGDGYRDFLEGFSGSDLLYIETVEIAKQFRGHDLGKVMVLETLNVFESGCAAVVLEPHPIRQNGPVSNEEDGDAQAWRKAMGWANLALTEDQYAEGAQKLRRYWRKLGFTSVPKSKRFLYRDCAVNHSVNEKALRKILSGFDADAAP